MVPVLDCQSCRELTPASRFRYVCQRLVCDHWGAENPQHRVHAVQTRDNFVQFTASERCFAQATDLNLDRPLGPRVHVANPETLRRLLAYLGAMPAQLTEFDRSLANHQQGNVSLTLEPGRKNLLRLRE
jgi:hypothetical protein